MIRCECCRADIASPSIHTIAGVFYPGWGLCRSCWRLVGRELRRGLRKARLEFQASPFLANSVQFYWLWEIAVSEARGRWAERRAA